MYVISYLPDLPTLKKYEKTVLKIFKLVVISKLFPENIPLCEIPAQLRLWPSHTRWMLLSNVLRFVLA